MPVIKLRKLPERTPVRIGIAVTPDLHRLLTRYASLYGEAYGESATLAELIPFMLETFLESDRDFMRACRSNRR